MPARKVVKTSALGEELGRKLLQSVRQMNARNFARVTEVPLNEVVEARQGTGLSQAEFAAALSISMRTLQEWEQARRAPSGPRRRSSVVPANIRASCAKPLRERAGRPVAYRLARAFHRRGYWSTICP